VNWAAPAASSSDGIWFGIDGEGGESRDYRAYAGNLSGTQTELLGQTASGLTSSNNIAAIYQTLFPGARFETAGAPGKNWVEAELRQTNNVLVWLLDGTVVAQRTNTSSFTSGNIMLGFMDIFSSIASAPENAFVLFDNVRVEDLGADVLQSPHFVSVTALTNGLQLLFSGAAGQDYVIEASTNLMSWTPIRVLTGSNGPLSFIDSAATNFSRRFYRARVGQ